MRVLSVGGGSGGHVTPVLAVINELKRIDPHLEASFVCDRAFESQSRGLMKHAAVEVPVHVISAGKLRRYHGVPLWRQLLDIQTNLLNLRDLFFIGVGFVQSIVLLLRHKPDVVFAKGGYVCLPLGYAAKLLGIPLVIHDSDTRPGLTNRLLGRFAAQIATGSPLENYNYPADRTVYTGVPIDPAFKLLGADEQRLAKQALDIVDLDKPLIVSTGGGLGAASINRAVLAAASRLLADGFTIYQVTGKKHYQAVKQDAVEHPAYHIVEFVYQDMATVLGAADLVISRASATFLQELAALAKPTIIVPAKHLGDQVKNAAVYQSAEAAYVLSDDELTSDDTLYQTIREWRAHPERAADMVRRFHEFARPDAAAEVARIIADQAGKARK